MLNNTFHKLFSNIKKRTARINGDDYKILYVEIDGCVLEIRYYDQTYMDFVKKAIKGIIVNNKKADFVIWCLEDNINEYIPSEYENETAKESILQGKDDSGEIQIINRHELSGADYVTGEYFYIRNNKNNIATFFYGHPLYPVFSIWAKRNDRFLIHGAVFGKNGEGILLGARGGAGKSTLSVSWMLNGGEIIGDDYVVIRKDEDLIGSNIYTSVGLKSDMEELLNTNMEAFYKIPKRNKKFFDASNKNFVDTMKIKAIVLPSFDTNRNSNPKIRAVPPSRVMTPLIHSTVFQTGEKHNITYVKDLANILSGLPTYEILLSRDIIENIKCVNKFIDNGFK